MGRLAGEEVTEKPTAITKEMAEVLTREGDALRRAYHQRVKAYHRRVKAMWDISKESRQKRALRVRSSEDRAAGF